MGPVDCLGGRRENTGMLPQEKGRRMGKIGRSRTLLRGSSLKIGFLEINGPESGWKSWHASAVRRALGRPPTSPSYRWSDARLGRSVGMHRDIVHPAMGCLATPPRIGSRPHPSWGPAPGPKGNLDMYESVGGLGLLIVTRHARQWLYG